MNFILDVVATDRFHSMCKYHKNNVETAGGPGPSVSRIFGGTLIPI